MDDHIVRTIARLVGVRAMACATTNLVNEANRRHGTAPTAAAALGQALTGGVLLGALLKVQQRMALKFEGDGPLQKIVVEADSYGAVRGYVTVPAMDLPKRQDEYDVTGAIGDGFLTVVKDLRLKNLYESVVPLTGGKIDADLTYYLNQSEQVPTVVQLGVDVGEDSRAAAAGGLLIQAIPPYDVEVARQLANRVQELPPVDALLKGGQSPEEILALVFADVPYKVLEQRPVHFKCQCSKERTARALIALGREEIQSLLETEGQAVVDCHFCHEQYLFNREELEELLKEMG
ncbi:MAG: Hsp33 family molecular chaperone HslO [Chloroflexi bacterium]|nr:Hsp33 family molecular chaperone HslO [Chloroflexota bacterium]MCI0581027.1 Hsp33 family molecular chaperone HslO [Chloroflexota bacterium]MCI0646366.1 Hsp33 family molecular chaperone HslO [Chloroflexota bacterium]MCI0728376.1 Hsp33 family molecular chaperone HslO [Chloroflexota bacterium]